MGASCITLENYFFSIRRRLRTKPCPEPGRRRRLFSSINQCITRHIEYADRTGGTEDNRRKLVFLSDSAARSALVPPKNATPQLASVIRARVLQMRRQQTEKERGWSEESEFIRSVRAGMPDIEPRKKTLGDRLNLIRKMSEIVRRNLHRPAV